MTHSFIKLASIGVFASSLIACGNKNDHPSDTSTTQAQTVELLNVSYDVSRDFYKAYNPLFVEHYKSIDPNVTVSVKQSHGGSSKQALSVANGLQADVVTMNQNSDVDLLVGKNLVAQDWQGKYANTSSPFFSATVLLVRAGNPKNIKNWDDLAKPDVGVVMPNPKTSGNGRYAFLGLYGYAQHSFGAGADDFTQKVLANIAILDSGARAATTSFVQRKVGDVLIAPENEAAYIANELNKGEVQVVYPSLTVRTETPVAVVSGVSDKKGTTAIATEYLNYLYSDQAQELGASVYLRPSNETILAKHDTTFPKLDTFGVKETFGEWETVMTKFFSDGGIFDKLIQGNKTNP